MADITRSTYSETACSVRVTIQKGRFVQDAELNEAQDNLRVAGYRSNQAVSHANGVDTLSITGGTNQVTIGTGKLQIGGYTVVVATPVTVTGLTTPGGARQDWVYLEIVEAEVADPNPSPTLGETSKRAQLQATFKVVEGSTVPASAGDPWTGGTVRMALWTIDRTGGVALISAGDFTAQYDLLPGRKLSEIAPVAAGFVTQLYAGTSGRLESQVASSPLHFRDTLTGSDADLSDNGAGNATEIAAGAGKKLRGANGSAQAPASILRALNGRSGISVGDGTNTFGEFNGSDAISRAIAYSNAYMAGAAVTIRVKAGTYAFSNVPLVGDLRIVGEGPESVTLSNNGGADTPLFVAGQNRLTLEGLTLTCTATAPRVASGQKIAVLECVVNGTLDIVASSNNERCSVTRCSVAPVDNNPMLKLTPSSGKILGLTTVVDCRVTMGNATNAVVVFVGDAAGVCRGVIFRGTEFVSLGKFSAITAQSGLVWFSDSGAAPCAVETVTFDTCIFNQPNVGPFLRLRPGYQGSDDSTTTASYLRSLVFRGCVFNLTTSTRAQACGLFRFEQRDWGGAAGTNNTTRAVLEDCTFDMGGNTINWDGAESSGTHDKAAVWVAATQIVVRAMQFRNSIDKLYNSGDTAPTNFSAYVHFAPVPLKTTTEWMHGVLDLNGFLMNDVSYSASGDLQPIHGLHVSTSGRTRTSLVNVTINAELLTTAILGTGGYFIAALGSSGEVTVRDCTLLSNTGTVHDQGITVSSVQLAVVDNCLVQGFSGTGINVSAIGLARVANCKVVTVTGKGIVIGGGATGIATVEQCLVSACTQEGILITGMHTQVLNNYVSACNGNVTTSAMINFSSSTATDTRVALGNKVETSGFARASIGHGAAAAAQRFIGFDTTSFGTWTSTAAMLQNDALYA